MRVLFVSTNRCREVLPPMPLGIASLAPYLDPRRHPFRVVDLMFEDAPAETLRRGLRDFAPEVVAFSIRNIENQIMLRPEFYRSSTRRLRTRIGSSLSSANAHRPTPIG